MNLLVTGGAGFIGSNFVHYWRLNYPDDHITVVDSLSWSGKRENLPDDVKFVQMDVCDIDKMDWGTVIVHFAGLRAFPTIVHFAAETHVDRSIQSAEPFVQSNVVGTHRLLEAALKHKCRFHHISTDEVYGSLGDRDPPFTESSPYRPNSPYAATKAASDHLVRAFAHTYGLPVTITHSSNNYGPRQGLEKLMPLAITNAIKGKPVPVYGNGRNIRDWIYVEDHCRAIDLVLRKGKIGESYNVGGGHELRNVDLVWGICNKLGSYPVFVDDRPGHDYRYAVSNEKIRALGFEPKVGFEEGLAKTIDWYVHQ